jgi:hypothetical protein
VRNLLKRRSAAERRQAVKVYADSVNRIAVVGCQFSEEFANIRSFVKELRARGYRQVDFYIAFKSQKVESAYHASLKDFPFNPSSFMWNGKFVTPELKQALNQEYDLLIDMSDGAMLEADVVIARIKAQWKGGRRQNRREYLFDFMLDTDSTDMVTFAHQMDNYLLNFNKQVNE